MSIFKKWLELDLTRAAGRGRLGRAIEVEGTQQELINTIDAGLNAVVVGESGVGKTALVYELAARSLEGRGAKRMQNRRVLQISLRRRLSTLEHRHEIHAEMQKLGNGVREMRRPPVLFIRDLHLIYDLDLEDELTSLACLSDVILIGEASEDGISQLLEYQATLRHRFGTICVAEPDLERATRIVRGWAMSQEAATFSNDAIEQAVALSHRFLVRSALPRKAIDLLRHASADVNSNAEVTSRAVVRRLSSQFRIPRVLVDPSVKLDVADLERSLSRSVIGQREAVSAVVDTIAVIKAGLTDVRRPLAVMMFAGPTGVGKTLIAQTIATRLFGQRDRLIRFNMADYQSELDATLLFGNAEQKERSLRCGQLTARMAGHSLGVLLLDEFEKCHTSVQDRFLQLMDEGQFVNGVGQRVSCRSFIIIVTTNAGHARGEVKDFGFQTSDSNGRDEIEELSTRFRFELLNRFDRIVQFRVLSKDDARSIVIAELRRLQSRMGLKQFGLTIQVEQRVIDLLVARGYDSRCGARNLRRAIERDVVAIIARLLVQGCPSRNTRVRVTLVDGTIRAQFVTRAIETRVRVDKERRPLRLRLREAGVA